MAVVLGNDRGPCLDTCLGTCLIEPMSAGVPRHIPEQGRPPNLGDVRRLYSYGLYRYGLYSYGPI